MDTNIDACCPGCFEARTGHGPCAQCGFDPGAPPLPGVPIIPAEVKAHDEHRDIAVLGLEQPTGCPPVGFASISTVYKGGPVVAYGFPTAADRAGADATDPTATGGQVSRIILPSADQNLPRLIQIDAAISPGNSGGPLFDAYGRLIGINTEKSLAQVETIDAHGEHELERVTLGEGIGWAVASDEILPLLDDLHIDYRVDRTAVSALGGLWHREPLIATALGIMLALSLASLVLASTKRGRTVVRDGVTRALTRSRPAPRANEPKGLALVGVAGPYAGKTLPIGEGELAIGRDPTLAQLVIPAAFPSVSKRHVLVRMDRARRRVTIEDCWSTQGTFLNDARLPPGQAVEAEDRFHLATPAVAFEVRAQ